LWETEPPRDFPPMAGGRTKDAAAKVFAERKEEYMKQDEEFRGGGEPTLGKEGFLDLVESKAQNSNN